MKTIVLFLLLVVAGSAHAQIAPDNEQILRGTINSSSEHYFPLIHSKYMSGDTTLTLNDYHYLYYGYAYNDSYNPLEAIPAETMVLSLLEGDIKGDTVRAKELLRRCKEVMKADPFSPKNLNFMTYAYSVLGDDINAEISADRFNKVIKTILASGTGLREKSPYHVLWSSHAADVIAYKKLQVRKRQIISRTVEYIGLVEKDGNVKGYFFDFGRMYWKKPENLDRKKRSNGWMLNGLKL